MKIFNVNRLLRKYRLSVHGTLRAYVREARSCSAQTMKIWSTRNVVKVLLRDEMAFALDNLPLHAVRLSTSVEIKVFALK